MSTPETVDTFPVFLKNGGIIQMSKRLTPCIEPVSTAEQKTDIAAVFQLNSIKEKADKHPIAKKSAEHNTGFLNLLRYNLEAD